MFSYFKPHEVKLFGEGHVLYVKAKGMLLYSVYVCSIQCTF